MWTSTLCLFVFLQGEQRLKSRRRGGAGMQKQLLDSTKRRASRKLIGEATMGGDNITTKQWAAMTLGSTSSWKNRQAQHKAHGIQEADVIGVVLLFFYVGEEAV